LRGGLNLYGFGHGDPVNYDDPFGLIVDLRGLSRGQRRQMSRLRKQSATFDRWYRAIDSDERVLAVRNPNSANETARVGLVNGGGFYDPAKHEIVLSRKGDPRHPEDKKEFEVIVAHEFAHGAAGLKEGTPVECSTDEECATKEANAVHRDLGWREREGYPDTAPSKPPSS
jgi:hypothetical protein